MNATQTLENIDSRAMRLRTIIDEREMRILPILNRTITAKEDWTLNWAARNVGRIHAARARMYGRVLSR